jgi:hypothetical protein
MTMDRTWASLAAIALLAGLEGCAAPVREGVTTTEEVRVIVAGVE